MDTISRARVLMRLLHDGVRCEHGLSVSDQIQGAVDKIEEFYDGEDKKDVIIAAYLHKSLKPEYIRPDKLTMDGHSPINYNYIENYFGKNVAKMVFCIATEPDDRMMNKSFSDLTRMDLAKYHWINVNHGASVESLSENTFRWLAVGLWAKELDSTGAQVILLADKLQEFEATHQILNTRGSSTLTPEYYERRMFVVEALKDVSTNLYMACVQAKEDNMKALETLGISSEMARAKRESAYTL